MLTENSPCIVEGWCENGGSYYREYKTVKEASKNHNTGDVYFWTSSGHQWKNEYIKSLQED